MCVSHLKGLSFDWCIKPATRQCRSALETFKNFLLHDWTFQYLEKQDQLERLIFFILQDRRPETKTQPAHQLPVIVLTGIILGITKNEVALGGYF